ncbi:salicylate synthase [Rhodococcus sp. no. 34]
MTSSTVDDLDTDLDPSRRPAGNLFDRDLTRVVAFAESGLFEEYVVYENHGDWVIAAGILGSVVMTGRTVTTTWDGVDSVSEWSNDPAVALQGALAGLPVQHWNAYGWVSFEFSAYTHCVPAGRPLGESTLAHLIIPRVEITFGRSQGDDIVVTGGTPADAAALTGVLRRVTAVAPPSAGAVDVSTDTDGYRERAAAAIDEVRRGDYTKVILSRTVPVTFDVDLPNTYRVGRLANTPARSFLLNVGDIAAAGFSPELVVAVDGRRCVSAEPLAGTRALGAGPEADAAARNDLEEDPKEIAEHAVSVRTAFREVASVSTGDSTTVTDFMSVRERGSVQHLASTVRGQLRDDLSPWDAFAAVFPAVTASGIPKRESIDAIARLDNGERGLYSGAVVRASSTGTLEAALVLRAVYQQQGRTWLRAGAGIVAQSTPDREFDETCEKLTSVAPYLIRRQHPSAVEVGGTEVSGTDAFDVSAFDVEG